MGIAFLHGNGGGGGGLNFQVVGGTTAPSNPKENTIWVNTDVKIIGWYFQANQPENMIEGEVWFTTGTSSPVGFNALKKNSLQVYPISAKQRVGGVLADVTAKSYQGGAWVDWIVYLYNNGTFYNGTALEVFQYAGAQKITYTEDGINVTVPHGDGQYVYACFPDMVDLADIKTVRVVAQSNATYTAGGTEDYQCAFRLVASKVKSNSNYAAIKKQPSLTANTSYVIDIDVSALDGEYYILLMFIASPYGSGRIDMDILEVQLLA